MSPNEILAKALEAAYAATGRDRRVEHYGKGYFRIRHAGRLRGGFGRMTTLQVKARLRSLRAEAEDLKQKKA